MNKILTFLLIFVGYSLCAQQISVSSFERRANDLDARVNCPVKDQNGDVCALIKIETTQTGFVFEAGQLGITKTEQKIGEYWVYLPWGVRTITLKHAQLGVLRDYIFPVSIDKATVYLMKLTTGKVTVVVEDAKIKTQWLIIKSTPEGADVFIDDQLAGTTPFQRKYEEKDYNYRIEKNRYHTQAGKISLSDDKETLDLNLKPKFGNIKLTSVPETGMQIYLDDEKIEKTTPVTLSEISSGEHKIKLQSEWYQPKMQTVTVYDEQTANLEFVMEPAFSEISIATKNNADISIDGIKKASGNWEGRLLKGIYTIKVEKDKYYSEEKQLKVVAGQSENLNFELKGKKGNLDIMTMPMEASVYLNDVNKGLSPLTINNLLVGNYEVRLVKKGYATITKTITIKESEDLTLNETLPFGKEISITSTPVGVELEIDGKYIGKTPYTGIQSFGSHNIKLTNNAKIVNESISVSQNEKSSWSFNVSEFKDPFEDEMVFVNGGTFTMGCTSEQGDCDDDEKPAHKVTLSDYYIGKYEVTQAQWKAIMGASSSLSNPSYFSRCDECPVEKVSWNDIQTFIKKLNQKTVKNYRLPTEAEWEYAARGGAYSKGYKYAGSNSIGSVAWCYNNSGDRTHPVGQKSPNELGIYDMSGNVWEWCNDWDGDYSSGSQTNPKGSSHGAYRVYCGGGWHYSARGCRVANRDSSTSGYRDRDIGFRLVVSP